jgi:hypothetical protein
MKRPIIIALVVTLVVALLVSGVVYGSGMRASKATAVVGNITWLAPNTGSFETILDQPIKMAQNKDLFVDVSMLCGLFTQTEVTAISQGGWDEGTAVAKIMVRVYAEDEDSVKHWASPTAGFDDPEAGIIFAMRQQDLWARLNTNNTSDNMTIGLALDTMDAHAFNFIIPNLDSGEYTVVIQAMTYTAPPVAAKGKNKGAGDAAWAGIGYGSVTIEQVRMAKDTVIVELDYPE